MQRRRAQWAGLLAVALLAALLRLYRLAEVPAGFYCDEAGVGYNAYTIASEGIDERGQPFPLFFWSFGTSLKNPLFIYTAALPVKVLGLDEFSVRLTAALFGIGTVIALFFLGRALFGPWVGLLAALFLAVAPWHLQFSRIAFELIVFPCVFVLGMTYLVRYTQGRRTLPLAMFFLTACVYAYQAANLFVPLFLVGFALLYLPALWQRWRETVLAAVVAGITAAPAAWFHYTHGPLSMRYFYLTTHLHAGEPWGTQLARTARYYAQFFSPAFLFESGDPIVRHAVLGFGELPLVYAPLIIIGVVAALWRRDRASALLLWWLALYPVAGSLLNEVPSASRGIIGVPAFCLLAATGLAAALAALARVTRRRRLRLAVQVVVLALVGGVLADETTHYLRTYFIDYPKYSAPSYGGFQYGYGDVIRYMETQRDKYDVLLLTQNDANQPQIFPLFYTGRSPRRVRGYDFGYLITDPARYPLVPHVSKVLAALNPAELDLFSDYTVHRRVVAPGGQTTFVVAELRARKRYLTNWLVLGLFPYADQTDLQRDFIDVAQLTRGRYHGAYGDIVWRPTAPQSVRVDLNRIFASSDPVHPGNPERACAYAATTLRAPTARTAFLELSGSDDYMMAWINGRPLTGWPMLLDGVPRRRAVALDAGDNLLVLKSCEDVGTWDFIARLTDAAGHDVTDVANLPEFREASPAANAGREARLQLVDGFAALTSASTPRRPHPDYRGESPSWVAMAAPPSEIAWRTAPVPARKPTAFAFTASISDEPGEMQLSVNGVTALTFQTGTGHDTAVWENGPYRMAFVSRKNVAGNSGVVLLQVPAEQITPGQPVELRVSAVSGEARASFILKDRTDTVAFEHLSATRAAAALDAAWTRRPREGDGTASAP